MVDEKRADYYPILFSLWHKPHFDRPESAPPIDVFMCTVSPPDKNGYCSFGGHLWNKRVLAKHAKVVLAEVDDTFIRTHGTNYIHVSEIDRFVDNSPKLMPDEEMEQIIQGMPDEEGSRELRAVSERVEVERRYDFIPKLAMMDGPTIRQWAQVYGYQSDTEPMALTIGQYVAELIPDGSCLQVGGGTPSTLIPGMGVLDEKQDLGRTFGDVCTGAGGAGEEGRRDGKAQKFSSGEVHSLGADGVYAGRDPVHPQQPDVRALRLSLRGQYRQRGGQRQHGLHKQCPGDRPDGTDHG